MRRLLELSRHVRAGVRRGRLDDQLRDEIDAHIALRRERLITEGIPPHEALARARRQFGNVTLVREESRAMWSFPALDTIVRDLAYALRMMRSAPAFTLVATLSLGVGMGGAAAVFGLADSVLLRELPVSHPRQLAIFRWSSGPASVFESLNGSSERHATDFSITSTSFSHHAFTDVRRTLAGRADVFGFAKLLPHVSGARSPAPSSSSRSRCRCCS